MKNFFRKTFLPWLAGSCFDSQPAYAAWLRRCSRTYASLRMLLIVIAVLPMLIGYLLDRHGVMLLTILPLVLVLLLSVALERTEAALRDQTHE